MVIAMLIPTLRTGGAERVCTLLANHWALAGHRVTVMTFEDEGSDAFDLGPSVQRVVLGYSQLTSSLWATLRKNVARIRAVRRQLQRQRADVAISFMSPANTCLALAALGTHTAAVGTERTFPPAVPLGRLRELARWALYGLLDHVVAQTRESADWVRSYTRARQVSSIPNPVTLPLPRRPPEICPGTWLRPGSRLVLAVGRLSAEKQFDHLIEAFASASRSRPSWQLAILGDGPLRAALAEEIRLCKADDRILLLGAIGNVDDWLSAADIYALSSAFEGYPNSLLEALASGVPAVAYDCQTGPRELIANGVNGILIQPPSITGLEAALALLMDDEATRQRLAVDARLAAQSHALSQIAPKWEAVFVQAVRARRLGGGGASAMSAR
jgi:glycosyltransferase involved in cell wall biosynthesis